MKKLFRFFQLLPLALAVVLNSCMVKPPKAFTYGSVANSDFSATIDFEEQNSLFLIPVSINGKEYKFFFDTGAPFSISEEIQESFNFKKVSQGRIVDTDKNRSKVDYVSVDSISIGDVAFFKQTAFVANFKDNPVLKCFGVDGIIGSNLMKDAQWIIRPTQKKMTICSNIDPSFVSEADQIAFTTDFQYDISIPIEIGDLKFEDVKLDYGSNGGISLSKHHFHQMEHHHLFKSSKSLIGMSQSGLLGKLVETDKKLSVSDSLKISKTNIKSAKVRIGGNDLIGTQVLSKLDLAIDWKDKKLYFKRNEKKDEELKVMGLFVGSNDTSKVLVISIQKDSPADKSGLKAGMTVLEANGIDLTDDDGFCKYIEIVNSKPSRIELKLKTAEHKTIEINLEESNFNSL